MTRLSAVFPWFGPGDVRSENSIGEPIELEDLSQFYYAAVESAADVRRAVTALKDRPDIHWIGPDYGGRATMVPPPNDPLFTKQWGLENSQQTLCGQMAQGNDILALNAWNFTTGVPAVRVAVLDTGIDTTHTELAGRARGGPAFVLPAVTTSYDDDFSGRHGTAMTGILGATGSNANAIAGVAWGIVPWAVKVVRGSDKTSRASWVSQGISWATANGIPILCMGLGFPESACTFSGPPISADSAIIMNAACLNALYAGQISIASMGNCNAPLKHWPAAFAKRVYAVGAEYMDSNSRWEDCDISPGLCSPCEACAGSSTGPWIDAVAPGGRLIVTLAGGPNGVNDISPTCAPNNGFVGMAFGGTSAAAGFAAGTASLLKSKEPSLLGEDVANIMNISADDLCFPCPNPESGYGRINAALGLSMINLPNRVFHHTIGPENSVGTLSDLDSLRVTQRLYNVPGLWGNHDYVSYRHRMRGEARYNDGFTGTQPFFWTRASGTWGWRDTTAADTILDYNEEVRSGSLVGPVVPGGWTGGVITQTLETFVYRVINPGNPSEGKWFPCPPDSARVAFTVVGNSTTVGVDDFLNAEDLEVRTLPNPAHGHVTLSFTLPKPGSLRVSVLDVSGRVVRSLIRGRFPSGRHELRWDGRTENGEQCGAGVYFVQTAFEGLTATRRFVLVGRSR